MTANQPSPSDNAKWDRTHVEAALDLLGVTGDWRGRVYNNLYAVVFAYQVGQFDAPAANEVITAIAAIADAADVIEKSLNVLFLASEARSIDGSDRDDNVRQIHHSIIIAAAHRILPLSLRQRYSAAQIEESLPFIGKYEWRNPWKQNFAWFANDVRRVGQCFTADDIRRPSRPDDVPFIYLIGEFAAVWSEATGTKATASRKGGDPTYRSPFVRFVETLWPAFDDRRPPSSRQIGHALARSPVLVLDLSSNMAERPEAGNEQCSPSPGADWSDDGATK